MVLSQLHSSHASRLVGEVKRQGSLGVRWAWALGMRALCAGFQRWWARGRGGRKNGQGGGRHLEVQVGSGQQGATRDESQLRSVSDGQSVGQVVHLAGRRGGGVRGRVIGSRGGIRLSLTTRSNYRLQATVGGGLGEDEQRLRSPTAPEPGR